MKKCEECNKKLGALEGFRHPALGARFIVCRNCFDKVDLDMKRWSKFCLSDSFNVESSKISIQDEWNKNISNERLLQKWFHDLWIKIGP